MASLPKPVISPQCLGYLRRLIGIPSPGTASSSRQQIRGKKKSAKGPHTVNVRLLEDIRGYGRKGSIIPVAPGRMRNIYYPQRKAEYVTASQLRTLNQKDLVIERDFAFGMVNSKEEAPPAESSTVVEVKTKLLTPKRMREIIEDLVPQEMVIYRVPIPAPEPEPEPSRPLGNSINAIGGEGPVQRTPESKHLVTKIFGSVTTADMVDAIKAVLAGDEEGAKVVPGPEHITVDEEMDEEAGVEADRVKALGNYKIEIKLKGVDPIRRTVSIRAQEMGP